MFDQSADQCFCEGCAADRISDHSNTPREQRLDEWQSQDGIWKKIAELDTDHLLNIVAMLHRPNNTGNGQRNKLVTLEKEALKRLTALVNPSAR